LLKASDKAKFLYCLRDFVDPSRLPPRWFPLCPDDTPPRCSRSRYITENALLRSSRFRKLLLLDSLTQNHRQIAASRVQYSRQPLRRRTDQEQQLRVKLFASRHRSQLLNLIDRKQLAVNDRQLKGIFRILLHPGGQRFRQGHWNAAAISDRGNTLQPLQRQLDLGAFGAALRQLVLHHAILAASVANHRPQSKVL